MNDSDHRDEIVRLEAQIDELVARIESCRKFILAGRIAVIGGGGVLITMLVSAIQFDPSVMALAVAAALGQRLCGTLRSRGPIYLAWGILSVLAVLMFLDSR